MPLSKNEIMKLIEKLQEKYIKYSMEKSPVFFNKKAFDERLQMAIENRMNLEAFALAEITNFEKIKNKYESGNIKTESFSEKVDKIIEEHIGMLQIYPDIHFHEKAHIEMTKIYGAMNKILFSYIPVLWIVISDMHLKNTLHSIENELIILADKRNGNYSKKINDFILILGRPGITELEIEKHQNNYLKECAFLLHDLKDLCIDTIESRESSLANPVSFNRTFISTEQKENIQKNFGGLTGYGVILEVKEYTEDMIANFRLSAFKRS
ncbi:MAG: hypothetical protein JW982_13840 [Spirochaetes bacterium]|nr:hypothetical protein [Spirochaetota bacterium]